MPYLYNDASSGLGPSGGTGGDSTDTSSSDSSASVASDNASVGTAPGDITGLGFGGVGSTASGDFTGADTSGLTAPGDITGLGFGGGGYPMGGGKSAGGQGGGAGGLGGAGNAPGDITGMGFGGVGGSGSGLLGFGGTGNPDTSGFFGGLGGGGGLADLAQFGSGLGPQQVIGAGGGIGTPATPATDQPGGSGSGDQPTSDANIPSSPAQQQNAPPGVSGPPQAPDIGAALMGNLSATPGNTPGPAYAQATDPTGQYYLSGPPKIDDTPSILGTGVKTPADSAPPSMQSFFARQGTATDYQGTPASVSDRLAAAQQGRMPDFMATNQQLQAGGAGLGPQGSYGTAIQSADPTAPSVANVDANIPTTISGPGTATTAAPDVSDPGATPPGTSPGTGPGGASGDRGGVGGIGGGQQGGGGPVGAQGDQVGQSPLEQIVNQLLGRGITPLQRLIANALRINPAALARGLGVSQFASPGSYVPPIPFAGVGVQPQLPQGQPAVPPAGSQGQPQAPGQPAAPGVPPSATPGVAPGSVPGPASGAAPGASLMAPPATPGGAQDIGGPLTGLTTSPEKPPWYNPQGGDLGPGTVPGTPGAGPPTPGRLQQGQVPGQVYTPSYARAGQPSMRPTQPTVDRSIFRQQLANPQLVNKLAWMVKGEVGLHAPIQTQIVQTETAFNRALSRGQSLSHVLMSKDESRAGYYQGGPKGTYRQTPAPTSAELAQFKTNVLSRVMAGSNLSDVGFGPMTGNASGSTARDQFTGTRRDPPQQGYTFRGARGRDGESYFREGVPRGYRFPTVSGQ